LTRSATAGALTSAVRAARSRPSFALYLVALALLPWKWLSPLGGISERAGWTDVFVAVAVVVWSWEMLRSGARPRLRAPHWALAAYVVAGALSALIASGNRGDALANLLLMVELAMLFVLTSDYASERSGRDAIVLVVLLVAAVTILQTLVGLGLFYLHVDTSLVGAYGDLAPSDSYARIAAGFYSAPLLGSFCIFASGVLAREDSDLPRSLLRAARIGLALVALLTFSRAIVGLAVAALIRTAHGRCWRRARLVTVTAAIGGVFVMAALTAGHVAANPARPGSVTYALGDPSTNPRLEVFETSTGTFARHPFLGIGPGALPGRSNHGVPSRAHSTPLNVAATVGLPALAALIAFLVALWRERRRPTDWATWSGLIGLGIDGLGQDIDHFRHVWVMFGLADAGRRKHDGGAAG
jgi:O-antigen ligase